MKKKLLVAAVAGALAVPGIALAAGSSVTIHGYIKEGLEFDSIGSAASTRANTSQTSIVDNSSRIIFSMTEDLGGGLSAIGQLDTRFAPNHSSGGVASGNTWVGLESDAWGRFTIGNRDVHYFHTADTIPGGATALDAWSVGILGFVPYGSAAAPTAQVAIANDTRTKNVIEYASPKWGMFSFGLAYSTDPYGTTGSMPSFAAGSCAAAGATCTNNKAYGWNFAPELIGGNWRAGYSYWRSQAPAALVTAPDQKSNRLWGYYNFAQGFRVGLTWDSSEADGHGTPDVKRNAWSIPVAYSWGPNSVGLTYTRANDVSISGTGSAGIPTSGTGAKLTAVYYQYALSKQTQMGVTYADMKNDSNASYNLFTAAPLGTSTMGVVAPGENPKALQFTLMHSF